MSKMISRIDQTNFDPFNFIQCLNQLETDL